jgi:hypothetical protein
MICVKRAAEVNKCYLAPDEDRCHVYIVEVQSLQLRLSSPSSHIFTNDLNCSSMAAPTQLHLKLSHAICITLE